MATARNAVRQSRARRAAAAPTTARTVVRAAAGSGEPERDVGVGERTPVPGRGEARGPSGSVAPREAGRLSLAVRERLPLWVQLRCGVELKTLLALALVLLVAIGFAVHHFWTGRPEAVRAPGARGAPAASVPPDVGAGGRTAKSGAHEVAGKRLVIDVAGKVRKPGIYRLPNGSRVADALESAGGVRPGTDVSGLNRARRLVDGEQIVAGGAPAGGGVEGEGASAGAVPGGGGAGSGASRGTVSLSSATAEQLETLPGVGPVLAQHILEFREQHGGFTSVDQLQDVNGIGERRFADIKPKVTP
ncbi:ComEA family DNA-binding protein [Streptomyces albidus (ex Kaewkla and Franco 2022)]|uniref:ComEA family DNA-binding protein n=1 Tax=Streptomyces albidus (ex Kaewkla and Franco 2022) TaxID=722709 RepID=UPI0028150602|nr:ComEA family DNA-binding protein [Streptomyces albidus (ex Kaewkla and Franco 2022)]